jgi:hypothetical protein
MVVEDFPPGHRTKLARDRQFSATGHSPDKNQSHALGRSFWIFVEHRCALD